MEHEGDESKFQNDWQFKQFKLITEDEKDELRKVYKTFWESDIGKWYATLKPIAKELPVALTNKLQTTNFDHDYGRSGIHNLYQGYVDDVSVLEEKNLLVITDWKSGKIPVKVDWTQLINYAIILFDQVPFDNILISNVYLEHSDRKFEMLKRENLDRYKLSLAKSIKNVESDVIFAKKDDTTWCYNCDYFDECFKI